MSGNIIDGQAIADKISEEVKTMVGYLKASNRQPHLRAVLLGDNPGSKMYAKMQRQSCEGVGIEYQLDVLFEDTSENGLIEHIQSLNYDPSVTAIILQMPLPEGFDGRKIQRMIVPWKDAEGMNPANMGNLFYGEARPGPCTAVGSIELLKSTGVKLEGKDAVVVGHSEIVGKPIAALLLAENATTSVCHIYTKDLASYTRDADILIVAAGKSQSVWTRYNRYVKKTPTLPLPDLSPLISADMIKEGAVVIDVAINRIPAGFDDNGKPIKNENGKQKMVTVGDVDFEAAKEKCSHITPVPGGVGPMTVAILLRNTVDCALAIPK